MRPNRLLWLILALAVAALALLGYAKYADKGDYYYCDMEHTAEEGKMYVCKKQFFQNGQTQTDAYAYGGKYSARCDAKNEFGPSMSIKNIFAGDVVEASVMRKSDYGFGVLTFQGADGWHFNQEVGEAVKVSNGWEQIKYSLTVPVGVEDKTLIIFCYYAGFSNGVVYFDDLKVRRIKAKYPPALAAPSFDSERINLEVEEKYLEKIRLKRAEAISSGVLLVGNADLVEARLLTKDGPLDVQARLKGDLPDHLMGTKWSFRILTLGKNAWQGMTEFSVHNSLSRYHLDEWVYHRLLEKEDILTTRYDFVDMALNGQTLGVYAFEEHFNEGLLRHRQRPIAPIIRWSEEGLWPNLKRGIYKPLPWFESAAIQAFGEKDLLKDEEQLAYFKTAQNLLYSFTEGTKKASEVFDVDRLAKFLALTDLCLSHHALNSTNLRFYFNPLTAKLEPIGYDGFTTEGSQFYVLPMLTGSMVNERTPLRMSPANNYGFSFLHYNLFNDYSFAEKYAHYTETFTDPAYLDSLKTTLLKDIEAREAFIRQEYTDYDFKWENYFRNADEVRKVLYPIPNISLKAHKGENAITLESYHALPLEVLGFGENEISERPKERIVLESFNEDYPVRRYEVPYSGKAKFVFCKTLGTSEIAKIPLFRWPAPVADLPALPKATLEALANFDFIVVGQNKTISVTPGKHLLNKDLLIPAGHIFEIGPGTELVLENSASIISYSPIQFIGTVENPILIHSEKKSGQGLLVLETKGKSLLNYVIFKALNARDGQGQATQSGVAFYRADVKFDHCAFLEIQSKNALSILHADYRLLDCQFENAAGDAFDADYSTGKLDKVSFSNIGKDAIEISGGNARIGQVDIGQAFGAGLNANQHAIVSAEKITVSDSEQGIVATDFSKLVIYELKLDGLQQGILAYQKLPEFGGSQIEVKNCEPTNVQDLHLVEDGSVLLLNGDVVEKH